ncbi:Serine/threonine-protein kinase-like protein [Hibiscus syriacus]|uniref:Serine/threonine-protein kinase-like protein n=1 Tax=Hibiscus syriacus TaxID=106335 RepID=A0A6A2ZVF9_HIBSY|nr:Serine/threonine-protein kinase-like protein [Hibiscus syriacus]
MPNGSLYNVLHSSYCRPSRWTTWVRFTLQVAKAIQTLNSSNPPVIHRYIKSSNVLIDRRWNARLGDFRLALIGHVQDVRVKCTPVAGTLGYLDLDYLAPSDVSTKNYVFSYGIMLLEIISGRHTIDVRYSLSSVVDWAILLIKREDFALTCDGCVRRPLDKEVIWSLTVMAARCVRSIAERRPGMEEVVECLAVVRSSSWTGLEQPKAAGEMRGQVIGEAPTGNSSSEEAGKSSRCVSRRNSRRVSSVTSEVNVTGDGVERSKSIGSFAEAVAMKMGPTEIDFEVGNVALVRKKPAKTPTVKLCKSRSMGVLQTLKLMNVNGSDDEKSESKILEKLLVLV